jgi:hypothetical protein
MLLGVRDPFSLGMLKLTNSYLSNLPMFAMESICSMILLMQLWTNLGHVSLGKELGLRGSTVWWTRLPCASPNNLGDWSLEYQKDEYCPFSQMDLEVVP